ncbi:hypothetical protein AAHK15_000081 [Salmonella enterica]|uniref:hypothetical protein n=1 Tax=Salmonella enterica TaxID=28901 RepID=UPI001CF1AF74|nr:hypothetical protein [Salmonella enterica]EGR6193774.1 hypothetical protein [Salmonella enterica]EHI4421009.1 hypothetical protein [Salmonella enterica]MCB2248688.1 hypothetical protein [Salmonella enterica subsp. diarizonae]
MNIEDLHNDLVTFTPAMSKGNWRMGSEGGARTRNRTKDTGIFNPIAEKNLNVV